MPLLAYKDAAYELGLPIGTLYSLVSRRRIPHLRLGKRLVRFDKTQLAAWVAKHLVVAIPAVAARVAHPDGPRPGRDSSNANAKTGGTS